MCFLHPWPSVAGTIAGDLCISVTVPYQCSGQEEYNFLFSGLMFYIWWIKISSSGHLIRSVRRFLSGKEYLNFLHTYSTIVPLLVLDKISSFPFLTILRQWFQKTNGSTESVFDDIQVYTLLTHIIHDVSFSDPAYLVVWVKKPNYLVWLVIVPRPEKGMRKRLDGQWCMCFLIMTILNIFMNTLKYLNISMNIFNMLKHLNIFNSRSTTHQASATLSLRVWNSRGTRRT